MTIHFSFTFKPFHGSETESIKMNMNKCQSNFEKNESMAFKKKRHYVLAKENKKQNISRS